MACGEGLYEAGKRNELRVKDRINPTHDEIQAWARTPGALYPMEDWDLVIARDENAEVFYRLATDPSCVNRDAMLNLLYVWAGQTIRAGSNQASAALLRRLIALAAGGRDDDVRVWSNRAERTLDGGGPDPRAGGSNEDYAFWFLGGWRHRREGSSS